MLKQEFTGPRRPEIVSSLAGVAEEVVASMHGMTGMAFKGALKAAKSVRADAVPVAIDRVLPQIADTLAPHWEGYVAAGKAGGFGEYLKNHERQVTDSLLGIADGQQDKMPDAARKIYGSLRKRAQGAAAGALVPLGQAVERFMP